MIDISAVGASVEVTIGAKKIKITQFSDEGTPFESPDVDVSTNEKNLNGTMISSRKASVYPVSVTVVAGTDDDVELQKCLQKSSIMPGGVADIASIIVSQLQLRIPGITVGANTGNGVTYTWTNGRMKSGPTGPSTSAEGRLASRTYTFEFEKYSPSSGSGMAID